MMVPFQQDLRTRVLKVFVAVKFEKMNSTNINVAAASAVMNVNVQEAVFDLKYQSGLWLCIDQFLDTLLSLSQEIETIWLNWKSFSLPALLYLFTRYPTFIWKVLLFSADAGPDTLKRQDLAVLDISGQLDDHNQRNCNKFATAANSMVVLWYIGVQGLLVARAYSLCRGNRILAKILILGFFSALFLTVLEVIALHGCLVRANSTEVFVLDLLINIITIYTDVHIFFICMREIWRMWKLRRETGFQSCSGLVVVFLIQTICCCVAVLAATVETELTNDFNLFFTAVEITAVFQNTLQAIIVADFTLHLRHRNSARIEASGISLSTLHFQSILQHVHQSFCLELTTPEEINIDENNRSRDYYEINLAAIEDNHDVQPGTRDWKASV